MKPLLASLLVVSLVPLLGGCDKSGPDPKVEATRLDKAKSLRSYFDKTKGDYNALTPTDRAEFIALNGGDATKAEQVWGMMKNGPGGGAGSSTSPSGRGTP